MRHLSVLLYIFSLLLLVANPLPSARADIVFDDDVIPTSSNDWNSSTNGYVGHTGTGSVEVNGGSDLYSGYGYIGHSSGSTGVVTVDGSGSTWSNSGNLHVGNTGDGTLNITNGAAVSVSGVTYVGHDSGSTGALGFGSNGGTLTTGSLYASPTQIAGTGTINARGLVSDVDLVFDMTHGLTQTLTLNGQPTRNVTVNLDMSGASGSARGLGAGYLGNGSLTIQDGIIVTSSVGHIGVHSGSTGTITVDGAGSTWTNSGGLVVGHSGSGTLNINDGGVVSSSWGYIGYGSGSTGAVTVDGSGSTWTNSENLHVGREGDGTLSVTGGGAVSNSCGFIGYESGSTGTATVDGSGSMWNSSYDLLVGLHGSGTLNVTRGAAVSSTWSSIGNYSDSTGVVTVDGSGSTWTDSNPLYIGRYGDGRLNITDGGAVSNSVGYIADVSGSTGTVTVDGAGSTWTNNGALVTGHEGSGTLSVSGGAAVSATEVSINDQSLLAIDVGTSSSLDINGGTREIDNGGTVRVVAGAGATGGVYLPIAAATWSGAGDYQAVGGTWDATVHEFTVSAAQQGASGVAETLDTSSVQRVLIDDGATGWSLGASFLAADNTSELEFTATAVGGQPLAELQSLLSSGHQVLGAWNFTLAGIGYTDGDPAYLSFDVGAGYSRSELDVWHYDGSDWTVCDAFDLTYDGQYASFTVTGFSGYAVTAPPTVVPEPGMLTLLIAGMLALVICGRRRR